MATSTPSTDATGETTTTTTSPSTTSPSTSVMVTTGWNASNVTTTYNADANDQVHFYIGLGLAIVSNTFIGASYIFKKRGLIRAAKHANSHASAGSVRYLRDWVWWSGMVLMAVGEIANFVAYGFAPATLVTPLGALSVIVAAILSSKFLHETLNLFGQCGCALCMIGSTMIVANAPQDRAITNMQELASMLADPGFLVFVALVIITDIVLIFYCVPRWGTTNPFVYVSITGTMASLTVMSCKSLALALSELFAGQTAVLSFWLMWFSLAVAAFCIAVQMNFLNRALDAFNTAVVTPILYIEFTACVLIASALLLKEWGGLAAIAILNILCGFLVIIVAIFLISVFKEIKLGWRAVFDFILKNDATAMHGVSAAKSPEPDGFTELAEVSRTTSLASADGDSNAAELARRKKYRPRRSGSVSDSEVPIDHFAEPPATCSEIETPYAAAQNGFANPAFTDEPLALPSAPAAIEPQPIHFTPPDGVKRSAITTPNKLPAPTTPIKLPANTTPGRLPNGNMRPAANTVTTHAVVEAPIEFAPSGGVKPAPFVFTIDNDGPGRTPSNDGLSSGLHDSPERFSMRLEDSAASRNLFIDPADRGPDFTTDNGAQPAPGFATPYTQALWSPSVV